MPDFIVTKVPFWSAIITQTQGSVSVPGASTVTVTIQPPSGETWLVWIDFHIYSNYSGSYARYSDYDGTNVRIHTIFLTGGTYGDMVPHLGVLKVLTNTLYAHLLFYNPSSGALTAYYGYSGFKLSQPLWSPQRPGSAAKPFKLSTDLPLPDPIKPLDKYKALVLGLDPLRPDDYELAVVLEENTPLAFDPASGFPVERLSVYVSAKALADLVLRFRRGELDPVKTGYKKYLDKWESEGIKLL